MHARIGTSGYQYRHWRGDFYPAGVPQRRWLEHYAGVFDTVEINATFYRLPSAKTVAGWHDRVPDGFRFAVKFSRYGSHIKRLKDPAASLDPFREVVAGLGDRLGPVLLQLPPRWGADPQRLDAFLAAAPDFRWAVELRSPDWFQPAVFDCLERHNAALCLTDHTPPDQWRLTADWTYLRFHGRDHDEPFGEARCREWADWLRASVPVDGEAWVFFNNDAHALAPADAGRLRAYLER